jgi:hypothetical protein
MDASDFPCRTELQRSAVGALFSQVDITDLLDGCDDDHQRLFSLLVELVDVYVRSTVVMEQSRDLGASPALGSVLVDEVVLEDPAAMESFERTSYDAWLQMTLTALAENLEAP